MAVTLFVLLGCNAPKTHKRTVKKPFSGSWTKPAVKKPPLPKTTILPRKLQQLRVSDLKVGESGWVVADSLKVDSKNRCWVYKFSMVRDKAQGYIEIKQTSKGLVILVDSKKKWRRDDHFGIQYYFPVAEIVLR